MKKIFLVIILLFTSIVFTACNSTPNVDKIDWSKNTSYYSKDQFKSKMNEVKGNLFVKNGVSVSASSKIKTKTEKYAFNHNSKASAKIGGQTLEEGYFGLTTEKTVNYTKYIVGSEKIDSKINLKLSTKEYLKESIVYHNTKNNTKIENLDSYNYQKAKNEYSNNDSYIFKKSAGESMYNQNTEIFGINAVKSDGTDFSIYEKKNYLVINAKIKGYDTALLLTKVSIPTTLESYSDDELVFSVNLVIENDILIAIKYRGHIGKKKVATIDIVPSTKKPKYPNLSKF